MEIPFTLRGRGRWFMKNAYLEEKHFKEKLKTAWNEWKNHIPRFQSIVH